MEQPMPAVKQHVLKVIDEQNVQGELFKWRKALKPKLNALQIGKVDDGWVKDELIDYEVFDQLRSHFYPVGSFPWSCWFFIDKVGSEVAAPSEIAGDVEDETEELHAEV